MGTLEQDVAWCPVCCTQHGSDSCPGHIELTGPERPGRRFAAHRNGRTEFYQTLVAVAGEQWRARVFTVPNKLWSVPGGRATVKFVDETPDEAERKAVLFIYRRCESLGVEVKELNPVNDMPRDSLPAGRRTGGERYEQELPALFGTTRAVWPARVYNISHGGLFLATPRPEPIGTRVVVRLQLEHYRIPLVGIVAWANPFQTDTLPPGIGVELEVPPFAYHQFVDSLDGGQPPG